MSENRNLRAQKTGVVVSNAGQKSKVVKVERKIRHARFGKVIRVSKKYLIHDETDLCRVGDTVKIMATRPISKRKNWRLVNVIEKGKSLTE